MSTLAGELPKEMTALRFAPLFIFRINVAKPSVIGQTPSIDRRVGEITGGVFEGERLRGKILSGGSDWQTVRRDGSWVLDVRFVMETDDNHLIGMTYKGIRHGPQAVLDRAWDMADQRERCLDSLLADGLLVRLDDGRLSLP